MSTPRALTAETLPWDDDPAIALKKAGESGKPVLLLVRAFSDIGSLDAGHWLTEDSSFNAQLEKFERVMVWKTHPSLKVLLRHPRSGFVFLTTKGELIAIEEIPAVRSALRELLEKVLRTPLSINALRTLTSAEMAKVSTNASIDSALFQRTYEVLLSAGYADDALPLKRVLNGLKLLDHQTLSDEEVVESERLAIEALAQKASRIDHFSGLFEEFKNDKLKDDRAKPEFLAASLNEAAALASKDDAKLFEDAKSSLEAFTKEPGSEPALKGTREALGKTVAALQRTAEPLKKEAATLREKFDKAHPDALSVQIKALGMASGRLNNEDNEKKARELVPTLLSQSMKSEQFAYVAGMILNVTIFLDLEAERAQLLKRVENELPVGRFAADIYLDVADQAYTKSGRDAAEKFWKAAEKASKDGESPTLYRAARQMRAQVDPDSSPNKSKWADREVLDAVVLAPDFDSYAQAIAQWTEKEFFPVLLQDDIYAPKFIAAFKPAKVVVMPSGSSSKGGNVPSIESLRRTILSSWTKHNDKPKIPEQPGDDDLRARLEKIGAKPLGLVFGDGESGEMAGALALAAGRFQGLEILPRQEVGTEHHIGSGEHYMSQNVVWSMNNLVIEGLHRWGLPYKDRWAYITLAGNYPFRYFGEPAYGYGTTYALDDFLGRDTDGTRLGVTTRLLGDQAMSAYQAMCSLFLQPESAFLFDTYGTNPKSIWGSYRQSFAEDALKDRLKVTHYFDKGATPANLDTFRARAHPWNRDGLILINSSGYPIEWSVGNGPGTTEDFPIGVPCAIHIVHSGSAAALYENTENIAYRALWGGAYWYLGSTAEPFLDAFQPPFIAGARMAAGVPLTACFRQRTSQNRWYPWRLSILGDAQFCLREKPAKRKEYKLDSMPISADYISSGGSLLVEYVRVDQTATTASPYELWLKHFRRDRLIGDRTFLERYDKQPPMGVIELDGAGAAMILEEYIKADRCADAVKLWSGLNEEARKNYAAQIYARYAAGHLLDVAQTAKNFDEMIAHFGEMLTTNPARNYVDRWNGRIDALAKEAKADEKYVAWFTEAAKDKKYGTYQTFLLTEALKHKKEWTAEDKATALEDFAKAVRGPDDEDLLERPFKLVSELYLTKVPAATPAGFLADARALFKEDSREAKRIAGLLKKFEQNSLLHKDWLILGSFKDAAAGAWEKVGPPADKTTPDFSAKFEDKKPIAWQRPFKPTDGGIIDLAALLKPNTHCYAYAAASVEVEHDCDGLLLAGSDDGITVWLDGKEIHRNPAERGVKIDEDKVPIKLSAGKHSLVLRIDQGTGGWGFCARIAGSDEKPLADVKLSCPEK
jgi:hypothetical protein